MRLIHLLPRLLFVAIFSLPAVALGESTPLPAPAPRPAPAPLPPTLYVPQVIKVDHSAFARAYFIIETNSWSDSSPARKGIVDAKYHAVAPGMLKVCFEDVVNDLVVRTEVRICVPWKKVRAEIQPPKDGVGGMTVSYVRDENTNSLDGLELLTLSMPSAGYMDRWQAQANNAYDLYLAGFAQERARIARIEREVQQAEERKTELLERLRKQPIIVYPDN